MKAQPTLHWNNFTVPELKEILQHCEALEKLGIAQDEDMMCSIERDITLRERKQPRPRVVLELLPAKAKEQTKQRRQEILLEQ